MPLAYRPGICEIRSEIIRNRWFEPMQERAVARIDPEKTTRPVGRPRRIDVQAITKAALDIGLDQVTMKRVAERLGVAVASLYQHIRNRDELVRLAALRQALSRRRPENAGQHWAELATDYARSLVELLVSEPRLIVEVLNGRLGAEAEVDLLEPFLSALTAHGFSTGDAMRLYTSVSTVAMGAAVSALNAAASQSVGQPRGIEIRRVLAERDPDELPVIRRSLPDYLDSHNGDWLGTLHHLLLGIAAARGEDLPADATRRPITQPAT